MKKFAMATVLAWLAMTSLSALAQSQECLNLCAPGDLVCISACVSAPGS